MRGSPPPRTRSTACRTAAPPPPQDTEYSVSDRGEHFYITLRDKARPNSELLVAPIAQPSRTEVRRGVMCDV
jgi:hypothetical protein